MSRTRAGRKAQETHREFLRNVGNFAQSMAEKKWKYSVEQTKAMIIERTSTQTNKTEVATFNQTYGELSRFPKNTFKDIFDEENSELGFSDLLADAFFAGQTIETPKAEYRLWVKPEPKEQPEAETGMICLNDRKDEFRAALHRAENSDLTVFPDFERDGFVVVNSDTNGEYRVKLHSENGSVGASCTCPDFQNRSRVCKHISEVLADTFFGALYGEYPGQIALPEPAAVCETVIAYCGCVCNREQKTTESYCERHEWDLEYWSAIAYDQERSAENRF